MSVLLPALEKMWERRVRLWVAWEKGATPALVSSKLTEFVKGIAPIPSRLYLVRCHHHRQCTCRRVTLPDLRTKMWAGSKTRRIIDPAHIFIWICKYFIMY